MPYALPRVDKSLDSVAGSQYFSTLDLLSGYWQAPLDEDATDKAAFVTKYGLWKWRTTGSHRHRSPSLKSPTQRRRDNRRIESLETQEAPAGDTDTQNGRKGGTECPQTNGSPTPQ